MLWCYLHRTGWLVYEATKPECKSGRCHTLYFCLGEDGAASRTAQADRAYHPDEIWRSNGQLKIDFDFYLAQQILPSIDRLCAPISGTDRARLAEYLGMCLTGRRLCSIFERFPGLDPARLRAYSATQQQPKNEISHHSGLNCQTKCASRIVRSLWCRVENAMLHLWNSRRLVNQR